MQLRHAVEFKIALNGIADVFQCLGHGRALGMATRQFGKLTDTPSECSSSVTWYLLFILLAGYAPALVSSMRGSQLRKWIGRKGMAVTIIAHTSSESVVNLRLIIICLLTAFFRSLGQAADTNLTADADARKIFMDTGIRTKLVATGEWSKPVTGGNGTSISGRILVYDGVCFTNEWGQTNLFAAPVFLEIHNETGLLTKIYFDWGKDVHFELRDVNGKPADDLEQYGGGSIVGMSSSWASVPADGSLRLRANRNFNPHSSEQDTQN